MPEQTIYEIPLDEIEVSDLNVRHSEADKDLDELAASIKKHGLLQPVLLLGNHDNPPYQLIVGQRRFLAHQQLRKNTIRAVFAGKLDKTQAAIRSLAENMHRVELNHADAAKAVTELYRHFKRDERRVASETGMSLYRVRQYIYIQERASEATKKQLREKSVTPVDVQRTLRAAGGNQEKADKLLAMVQKHNLNPYEKKRMVDVGLTHPKATPKTIIEESLRPRVEQSIMVKLSGPVRQGLEKAAKSLAMDREEVASQALTEWLSAKGFLREEA